MPLHIGEKLFLDGEIGRVVATTDTTDANGRGSVSYGGHAFSFRALKATVDAVDYPLVATADAEFRVGVVQQDANPALFCMVLDDGPAPWGWGRRVKGVGAGAPTYWAAAEAYADEDAVVFRMGWAPGEITILKGGVEEAGVYADLVLTYATSDGEHVAWWQPAYPSKAGTTWGAAEGRFQTDANGVLWDVSEGSSQPIIVPRGFGALGYRSEEDDGWLSCPTAERTLSKLEVWYQQEHAEVSEGIGTTLNVAGVSITITGPSNATVELQWENGIVRGNPQLTGGTATLTGLPPGKYCVRLYSDDLAEGIAPQEVQCESGGDYTVAFGSWITVDPLKIQGVVYAYGATPAAGATLWACYETGPGGDRAWTSFATCDANGAYGPVAFASGLLDIFAYHATWGAGAVYGFQDGAADGFWWDPTLGATFGGIVSANTPDFQESIEPWGAAGPHENLMLFSNVAYAIDPDRQTVFRFGIASGGHGIASEPCPRGWWSPDSSTEANEWTAVIYDIYDADDTLMASAGLADSATPPWSKSPIPYAPRDQTTIGRRLELESGGKIDGNVIEASRGDLITTADLTEAARMGLETGKFTQPLEVRSHSETAAEDEGYKRPTTFGSWECPYCGGPAWYGPDDVANGYKRGYCIPCWAEGGVYCDCRTYFLTQTLQAFEDWSTRPVKNTTGGGHSDKLIQGWPRPAEYYETDDYLVDPWEDGLPRWVAMHIVLGSLAGGTFTDGESIADAEARVGDTIGPVQLKLQLLMDYAGTGKTIRVTATNAYTEAADLLEATVPAGAVAGDLIFLKWGPHDAYPGSRNWYTDVTDVTEVTGDGALSFAVVNDGPSWRSSAGCIVTHHAYSPWACDARLGRRDPFLVEDFVGRLHLVYVREGRLMHRVLEGTDAVWGDPVGVSLRANWPHPCEEPSLAPLPHAELLAAAHTRGATRLWRTRDDGNTWSG